MHLPIASVIGNTFQIVMISCYVVGRYTRSPPHQKDIRGSQSNTAYLVTP